ncbi:MAG: murein hydrolase activator EnvC family protein, partial [Bacilli bacterium]
MKYKKPLLIMMLVVIFSFINQANLSAEVTFTEENKEYYKNMCSTLSSYKLNKEVCDAFQKHAINTDTRTQMIIDELDEATLTASQLVKMINDTNALIIQKQAEIDNNNVVVAENTVKVERLTEDLLANFEAMQYMNSENQIIDILMSATSVDDLMLRIDSITNISRGNLETINELEKSTKELDDAKRYLDQDLTLLKDTQTKQEAMLIDYRRKEALVYQNYSSAGQSGIIFNDSINSLKPENLQDKSSDIKNPIASGLVSATTWAYPDGGWHPGLDIATPVGTPILAPMDGAILATAKSGGGGYGIHMVSVHQQGDYVYTFVYAHMSDFSGVNGFKKGDVIGY